MNPILVNVLEKVVCARFTSIAMMNVRDELDRLSGNDTEKVMV